MNRDRPATTETSLYVLGQAANGYGAMALMR